MHARIEELEREALHAQVRLAEELEEVRRSFRAELRCPTAAAPSSCVRPTLAACSGDRAAAQRRGRGGADAGRPLHDQVQEGLHRVVTMDDRQIRHNTILEE